jgi:hypothetical protein
MAKRRLLAANPTVLRKVRAEPAPKDRPNAAMPDAMLGSDPLIFRAPRDLVGLVLHTIAGAISVPDHGIVEAAAHHTELHAELLGRDFRQLHGVDRFGKSATGDPVQMFVRGRLQPIGGDLLKSLGNRAEKASAVPTETRQLRCRNSPTRCAPDRGHAAPARAEPLRGGFFRRRHPVRHQGGVALPFGKDGFEPLLRLCQIIKSYWDAAGFANVQTEIVHSGGSGEAPVWGVRSNLRNALPPATIGGRDGDAR